MHNSNFIDIARFFHSKREQLDVTDLLVKDLPLGLPLGLQHMLLSSDGTCFFDVCSTEEMIDCMHA